MPAKQAPTIYKEVTIDDFQPIIEKLRRLETVLPTAEFRRQAKFAAKVMARISDRAERTHRTRYHCFSSTTSIT